MAAIQEPDLHMAASELGIERGALVIGSDNKRLGEVSELRGPYFKVHRRFARDAWIELKDVAGVFQDQVSVNFSGDTIADYRVPPEVVNDASLDARTDHLLDGNALAEQRARLERDLGDR